MKKKSCGIPFVLFYYPLPPFSTSLVYFVSKKYCLQYSINEESWFSFLESSFFFFSFWWICLAVVLVDMQSCYMDIISHLPLNKSFLNPFNCKPAILSLYNFLKGLRKANTINGRVLHVGNPAGVEMQWEACLVLKRMPGTLSNPESGTFQWRAPPLPDWAAVLDVVVVTCLQLF